MEIHNLESQNNSGTFVVCLRKKLAGEAAECCLCAGNGV